MASRQSRFIQAKAMSMRFRLQPCCSSARVQPAQRCTLAKPSPLLARVLSPYQTVRRIKPMSSSAPPVAGRARSLQPRVFRCRWHRRAVAWVSRRRRHICAQCCSRRAINLRPEGDDRMLLQNTTTDLQGDDPTPTIPAEKLDELLLSPARKVVRGFDGVQIENAKLGIRVHSRGRTSRSRAGTGLRGPLCGLQSQRRYARAVLCTRGSA